MSPWISRVTTLCLTLIVFGVSAFSYQFIWSEIGGSQGLKERVIYLLSSDSTQTIPSDEPSTEISELTYSKISGDSMAPTLQDGETYLVIPPSLYQPQLGDMLSFRCVDDDRCFDLIAPDIRERDGLNESIYLVKRWVHTEADGCMHLEGDNKENSWDSRSFGCLYPEEVEILGTVWKNN